METIKKHPTHFKVSSLAGGLFLVLAIVSFGIGIYLQQKGQIEASHKFALSFLINTAVLITWLIFRMRLCKCPNCKKWLSTLAPGDTFKSRKFICKKCNIVWDTGYVMYFEMTDPS